MRAEEHSKNWGKNGGGYLPYGHAPVFSAAALDSQPVLRASCAQRKEGEDDWNQSQKLDSVKGKNARGGAYKRRRGRLRPNGVAQRAAIWHRFSN
jgi:hypothetical protein